MLFSEFAQIIYKHSGHSDFKGVFVSELFDYFVDNESHNPFSELGEDMLSRCLQGTRSLSVVKVRKAFNYKDTYKFADYINTFSPSNQVSLEKELKEIIPDFNCEDNLGFACADLFLEVLNDLIDGEEHSYKDNRAVTSPKTAAVPTSSVYYDETDGKLHIGETTLDVPKELFPPEILSIDEIPYTKELLLAFASALHQEKIEITELPEKYAKIFRKQRMNYYSAVRIDRFVRESIDNGDEQAAKWKADTYDYIEETLDDDYPNGERRLNKVMQKVVDSTTTSIVSQFQNFVGPKEKKGVCHLLANDGKVKWVVQDDERL